MTLDEVVEIASQSFDQLLDALCLGRCTITVHTGQTGNRYWVALVAQLADADADAVRAGQNGSYLTALKTLARAVGNKCGQVDGPMVTFDVQ